MQFNTGHHIVSWYDEGAAESREILRRFGIDIDSSINGVYLPRFRKHLPHKDIPNAYAHSEIHTDVYYINVTAMLKEVAKIHTAGKEDIEAVLEDIGRELQQGKFPLNEKVE